MNANDVVVGMGEVLWDMLPEGKKIGGAPANFAYHVSQFGLPSCVVSAVGEDALGKEILDNFTSKGLNCHIATVPYATGTVQVSIDQAGVPQYEIKENVAWDNIPYTPALEALARRTKAVCFGSLAQRSVVSRNTIGSYLDAMPENDETLVVFDVNLRQGFYNKEILCNSMKRCNILKINDEELIQVSRMFGYPGIDLQDKCWILLGKYNLKMLILTCGINGSYVFTPGNISFLPTPQGGGGRYGGCRRQLHRCLHLVNPEGQERRRGACPCGPDLRLCLHPEGCHAGAASAVDGTAAVAAALM